MSVPFRDAPIDYEQDRLCGDCLLKQRDDAVMLLRRLLRFVVKGNIEAAQKVAPAAQEYLRRKNLQGEPIRES